MKHLYLLLFIGFISLSCSEQKFDISNEEIPSIEDEANFIGTYHNKALDVFYEKGLDVIMKDKKKEIESKLSKTRASDGDISFLYNEEISSQLLNLLGEGIIEKFSNEISVDEIYDFMDKYQNEICPTLVKMAEKNPNSSYAEIFLKYCNDANLMSTSLCEKYNNDLKNENMTRAVGKLSPKETKIMDISSTVFNYSVAFWDNHYSANSTQTRIKGSTVRGFMYDSIGAGIGAAISGGTASFFLGALFSAMQNEWGENESMGGSVGGW